MYESTFHKQKQYYQSGKTLEYKFRINALNQLKRTIKRYEDDIFLAFRQDFNKDKAEAFMTEIGILYSEINFAKKHLSSWMAPSKVKTPVTHFGSTSEIYKEPYGVTLIISPWNYPFNLMMSPLIGAISAGNTAVLKPSEHTPAVSSVINMIIEKAFPPHYITAYEGGVETNQSLLKLPFDYIFYTGSSHVGQIVMEEASKHLTPVTLELGGKSPGLITRSAKLKTAAKRIVWAKFINAGQTCVAPDYIYIDRKVKDKFLKYLIHYTRKFYGGKFDDGTMTQIINDKHVARLSEHLNGDIIYGGRIDEERRMIEPAIIDNVEFDHSSMQEEIFGPILPVITYDNLDKAMLDIRDLPDPLALYLFTENKDVVSKVISNIPFGGGAVNDAMYHLATPYLPFGGRGHSGMGRYHGKYSFDTFTHEKSMLKQTTKFDVPLRYPTFKPVQKLLRLLWN